MIKPVEYYQLDYPNTKYAAPSESGRTIKTSGCGITSAAMVIQTLRPNLKVTPPDTAKWSMAHGYKIAGCGTSYAYFVPQMKVYGLKCEMLNSSNIYHQPGSSYHSKALKKLKEGSFIIACMGPGTWTKAGHYVVLWQEKDGEVYINDPASHQSYRAKNKWTTFKNEVKYYWSISYGDKTKTVKDGNFYKDKDVLKGKFGNKKAKSVIWVIKDCKDGWSIVTDGTNVGYMKNVVIDNNEKLSKYKTVTATFDTHLREKNLAKSKVIQKVTKGTKMSLITSRQKWSNVKIGDSVGYVPTKKIK